ncbi:hypothetical protein LEN26_013702 [Aphanomyces euteiches]|nr:hypothetical protein LEN26_013702 [Aphanomyces euteiches]
MGVGRRDLTDVERESIMREILLRSSGALMTRMPKGFGEMLADKYGCHVTTIRKVLARAKEEGMANGNMAASVRGKKKGRVGRKFKFTAVEVKEKLIKLKLDERTTLRSISELTNISRSTLHRYLKLGMLRSHTSAIRPVLTTANKYARLQFAISHVDSTMRMSNLCEYVHLDEKWFYLTKETKRYYLAPGYVLERRRSSKIQTIRVLVEAKRDSVNRLAGTPETKPITVTREVYRSFLLDKVLPAIVEKWPIQHAKIILQHDNAKPHMSSSDPALRESFRQYLELGWCFDLRPQPPNSPDFNVLDLGFFAAIQSLQHRQSAKSIDELVVNVINAFETYPFEKLNNAFITLQCCMIEAIKCNGDNTYKIPHMSKEKLSRLGMLPEKVPCDEELFRVALTCLDAHDQEEMTKILQAEVEEARQEEDLASALANVVLRDEDEAEDLFSTLSELGIEPISIME